MDDNIRYSFCIEMANLARSYADLDAINEWYARAWYYLWKNSESGERLRDFHLIRNKNQGETNV